MGRPFIRQLPCKEGDRFYACRFCGSQIASAARISVAEDGSISRGTFQDFVNVYTPNTPKKSGRHTIQEFFCAHCNGRLGFIILRRNQSCSEFIYGEAVQLMWEIHDPEVGPPVIEEILDDQGPHDGIQEDANYIVEEPDDDDDEIPASTYDLYICRTCYNQIAFTKALWDANFSPPGSGLTGGLFEAVVNVENGDEIRFVGVYMISNALCIQCSNHLGWQFTEVRAPVDQVHIISGDYLMIMDRLMILIVDGDD